MYLHLFHCKTFLRRATHVLPSPALPDAVHHDRHGRDHHCGPAWPQSCTSIQPAAANRWPRKRLARKRLARKDLSEKDRAKAFWSLSLLLMAWFVVATLTSLVGFYQPPSGSAPTIQYGLVIPIVLGVLLFRAWPLLRRTLAVIPNSWLVGVQLYRALGAIFLILYAGGHLPA